MQWGVRRCAGIVVVARSTSRVLLLQRSDNGRWENPGGHLEAGESFREAALRELQEETGYGGPVAVTSSSINTGHVWVRYECFVGLVGSEFEPELTEHAASGWFARDQLPSGTHPGTLRAVRWSGP